MKLEIELVPQGQWFKNLRSELTKGRWDVLRKNCYKKADYKCEICGGKGHKHPVECHEIWIYNDEEKTQTLIGLIALCPSCHECKHIGLAQVKGNLERALKHFCKVNECTDDEAIKHVRQAFRTWDKRSKQKWEIDISWATENTDE